jgi:hypothetical protein
MSEATQNGGKKDDPVPQGPSRLRELGEIAIEIDNDNCNNTRFAPLSMEVRGRWSNARIASHGGGNWSEDENRLMNQMPEIPGQRIILDCRTGKGRIVDPLSLPANAGLLADAKRIVSNVLHQNMEPVKEVPYDNMTATEIKTWLYWMHRMVDGKIAKLVSGKLLNVLSPDGIKPSELSAAIPGAKTGINFDDHTDNALKFIEDLPAGHVLKQKYMGSAAAQQAA